MGLPPTDDHLVLAGQGAFHASKEDDLALVASVALGPVRFSGRHQLGARWRRP